MPEHTQAITPSDLEEARRIFGAQGIAFDRVRFNFLPAEDRWEMRDALLDNVVASRDPDGIVWTVR
jgi:hypothetical protein